MKRISSSRRDHYLVKVCVFLTTVALITGTTGCASVRYTLSISSTAGGTVIEPGEGSFTYAHDTVVDLVVEAEEGYGLTWTGDVHSIASIHSVSTNITMYDNYSITATFVEIQGIQDWYDLDAIRDDLSGHYALMNDLDSATAGYEELAGPNANRQPPWEPGKGWEPIGNRYESFTGRFDGQEYEIRDLCINRTDADEDPVGLFGSVDEGGRIENIGIVNANVTGFTCVGGLVGLSGRDSYDSTVSNCYASGNISGRAFVGGLVGVNLGTVTDCYSSGSVTGRVIIGGLVGMISFSYGTVSDSYSTGSVSGNSSVGGLVGKNCGTVSNCYATGNVNGDEDIGGLVGLNWGDFDEASVSNSHSTGDVNGDEHIGGLVGRNIYCTVVDSHSVSSVNGNASVGGLVGWNEYTVSNCYASGNVTGDECVGGLAGDNTFGTLSNSYSIGDVTGDERVGGLIGKAVYSTVSDSYSTSSVTGNSSVGGLLGWWNPDYCTVSNCFWDTETSRQATSAAGTGKTTAEMHDITTFSRVGWNIITVTNTGERNPSYTWNIVDDETYPFLSWQP
jgi:hypothetical protein